MKRREFIVSSVLGSVATGAGRISLSEIGDDSGTQPRAGAARSFMKIQYLEVVTSDVDAVCAGYEAALGVKFGPTEPLLGGARTAPLPDGGSIGVRGPLRDTEKPVVRPYWLVEDIDAALAAAEKQGAAVAHAPLEIPGKGTFAIYVQGDVDHGLWQL